MYYCLHTSLALLLALVTASSLSPLLPPPPPPTLEIRRSSASITLFFLLSCLSVFCPDSNFPPLKSGTRRHFFDTHAVPQTLYSLRDSSPFSQFGKWGLLSAIQQLHCCIHRLFHSLGRAVSLLSSPQWHTTALNTSLSSRLFQNQSFPEIQISRHDRQQCSPAVDCV